MRNCTNVIIVHDQNGFYMVLKQFLLYTRLFEKKNKVFTEIDKTIVLTGYAAFRIAAWAF